MFIIHFVLFITIMLVEVLAVPPAICREEFRWDDCGLEPKPVMYYWKKGSRCEVGLWKGCLPNPNMFADAWECSNACIYQARALQKDTEQNQFNETSDEEINTTEGSDSDTTDGQNVTKSDDNQTTSGSDTPAVGTTSGSDTPAEGTTSGSGTTGGEPFGSDTTGGEPSGSDTTGGEPSGSDTTGGEPSGSDATVEGTTASAPTTTPPPA